MFIYDNGLIAGIDEIDVRRYPDKAYQVEWIRYYLECKAEQNGQTKTDIKDRDVEDFYVKVNKFTLVSVMKFYNKVKISHSKILLEYKIYATLVVMAALGSESLRQKTDSHLYAIPVQEFLRQNTWFRLTMVSTS